MKAVRCPYNHLYNPEKYAVCPYCRQMGLETSRQDTSAVATVAPEQQQASDGKLSPTLPLYAVTEGKTAPAKTQSPLANPGHTLQPQADELPPTQGFGDLLSGAKTERLPDSPPQDADGNAPDCKTVGFFAAEADEPEDSAPNDREPVVGWLVGLSGRYLGCSFEVRSGKNSIGRDADMDISLADERTISRHKHAVLIFDPVHNRFILQSGTENGLVYVNGNIVMQHKSVKHRDKIVLGKALFMLVALCGPYFSWDTYFAE